MKAVRYYGPQDIRVERVPDPTILNPRDAIVRVTATAICGSDLHIYGGYIPTMRAGDILGHEFMGEVVRWAVTSRPSAPATASSSGSAWTTRPPCTRSSERSATIVTGSFSLALRAELKDSGVTVT